MSLFRNFVKKDIAKDSHITKTTNFRQKSERKMENLALQARLISVKSKEEKEYLRPKKVTTRNTPNFCKKRKHQINRPNRLPFTNRVIKLSSRASEQTD